jgi:DNA-binding transcriptional LysR family regulator
MNYNKLFYFQIVAKHLNFTKAAEELYISQSAVSRHMKELEDDFGVKLFVRTNRNLLLTKAGKVLYEKTHDIFSRESEIYSAVRAAEFGEIPELRIGAMGIKSAYTIPIIANELINDIPNLKVSMQRFNWDTIGPALKRNEIHVALRLRFGKQIESNLNYRLLDCGTPSMIVHKTHRLADRASAHMSEFAKDTFLVLSQKESSIPFRHTLNFFRKNQMQPDKILKCGTPEELVMMVNSAAGVSLMSKFALIDQFPDIRIIDIKDSDPLYLELVWLKESNRDIPVDIIEKFAAKMQSRYTQTASS